MVHDTDLVEKFTSNWVIICKYFSKVFSWYLEQLAEWSEALYSQSVVSVHNHVF